MAVDNYGIEKDTVFSSSMAPFSVTPHDTNPLATVPKGLYIGTGGDVVLRGVNGGTDVTFKNVPDGKDLPVRASHVRATGTTASDIVAY